eukprot:CAMPEP_0170196548 /NCGR_PEP_ID=MMETSP0040_2-20121228/64198_1 /TAXON_ID=641309 /ORGANISM="Lotharella oceanica, Strain CCMP622" /LENGTH=325 /DNA_ID=CAMNT_0010445987 /DNA_START=258 /DNA_END=1235 /DNA_ORIENTATION=+
MALVCCIIGVMLGAAAGGGGCSGDGCSGDGVASSADCGACGGSTSTSTLLFLFGHPQSSGSRSRGGSFNAGFLGYGFSSNNNFDWSDFAGVPSSKSQSNPAASAAVSPSPQTTSCLYHQTNPPSPAATQTTTTTAKQVGSSGFVSSLEEKARLIMEEERKPKQLLPPEVVPLWQNGIKVLFSHWQIARIAIQRQTAGRDTLEVVSQLQNEVEQVFLKRGNKISRPELATLLQSRCDEAMNIEAEDGSPSILAHDLLVLYNDFLKGQTAIYDALVKEQVLDLPPYQWVEKEVPPVEMDDGSYYSHHSNYSYYYTNTTSEDEQSKAD